MIVNMAAGVVSNLEFRIGLEKPPLRYQKATEVGQRKHPRHHFLLLLSFTQTNLTNW